MKPINRWEWFSEEPVPVPEAPVTAERDTTAGRRAKLPEPSIPVEGRAVIIHVTVALLLPFVLLVGRALYSSGFLPEIMVGSVILGSLLGLLHYLVEVKNRHEAGKKPDEADGILSAILDNLTSLVVLIGLVTFWLGTV